MNTAENILDHLVYSCSRVVPDDNLVCILFYGGSSIAHQQTDLSDLDIVIFLRRFSIEHLKGIRSVLCELKIAIDSPVVFLEDMSTDPSRFTLVNHGCYFVHVLKNALVLFGGNPLIDIPNPDRSAINESLRQKVCEYADAAVRQYLEKKVLSVASNYQMNNRLLKAIQDLHWVMSGNFQPSKSASVSGLLSLAPDIFTEDQWKMVQTATHPEKAMKLASNNDDRFLKDRVCMFIAIRRKCMEVLKMITD